MITLHGITAQLRWLGALVVIGAIGCAGAPTVDDLEDFLESAETPTRGALVFTFFPTGIGDAILVEFPNGSTLLVDAGIGWEADRITSYITARGIESLDAAIVTHPHLDHFGGLQKILESVRIGRFFDNGVVTSAFRLVSMYEAIDTRSIPRQALSRGDTLTDLFGGSVTVDTLYPDDERREAALHPLGDENRGSIVLRLEHGQHRILLMGDAEVEEEERLVELEGDRLRAQVVKLGHHASIGSSTAEFLEEARPQLAIAQGTELVNVPPFYPRPCWFLLGRLRDVGARLVETGKDGLVQVVSDSDGLRWTSWERRGVWSTIETESTSSRGPQRVTRPSSTDFSQRSPHSHVFQLSRVDSDRTTKTPLPSP